MLCGLVEAYELGKKMTKEELIAFLKEALSIRVEVDGRFKIPPDRIVRVQLLLGEELISQSEEYLD